MDAQEKAYLDAASEEVYRQMEENPGLPIPVDPDVAEYMGAFADDALDLADALDDANGAGVTDANATGAIQEGEE